MARYGSEISCATDVMRVSRYTSAYSAPACTPRLQTRLGCSESTSPMATDIGRPSQARLDACVGEPSQAAKAATQPASGSSRTMGRSVIVFGEGGKCEE